MTTLVAPIDTDLAQPAWPSKVAPAKPVGREPAPEHVLIPASAKAAFDALLANVMALRLTFQGQSASLVKRDEALLTLLKIEAGAHTIRMAVKTDRAANRRSA